MIKKTTKKPKPATIFVAMPKSHALAKTVESQFSRLGWNVRIFDSALSCWKALGAGSARLCIIDYSLSNAQQFIHSAKGKKETSLIPIVVLFPEGRDPKRSDEFRICGDQHLAHPVQVDTLTALVDSELARSNEETTNLQRVCAQFPTSEENLDRAGQFISELLSESGLSEQKQVAMSAAYREATINAAQHGNRYQKGKQIEVSYHFDKEKVTITVSDEGEGFNHRLYLQRSENSDAVSAARERYEQGRLGGLGIMLMVKCADQVEYNEKGNAITLTKFL
jgi:serine/threonine-protein kinase RsbW